MLGLLLAGPVLSVLALRLPLINQLEYADAWFYSAYAWSPEHHFLVHGWTYFSVRFPAILSIGGFGRVLGTYEGYVVLRYLLAVAAGVAVYLALRRAAGTGAAVAGALLLYLNPFFSRMLLWDYSGFVAVAAGVVGVALWWWADDRHLAWTFPAGAALAIAAFAYPLLATAAAVFLAVEGVAAIRRGRGQAFRFAGRLAVSAVAGAVVLVVGYVSYLTVVPAAGPQDLLRPTIDFLRANEQNAAPYQRPMSEWLLHELRVWAPVVLCFALVAAFRRRVLGTDVTARVVQACMAYVVFLWLYRVTVTSSVIETWWAYTFVVVVMAPAMGILIAGLDPDRRNRRLWAGLLVGTSALLAIAIRAAGGAATDAYAGIAARPALLYGIVGAGLAAAALVAFRARPARIAGAVGLAAVLTVMVWAPSVFDGRGTTGVFVVDGETDWGAYSAARRLNELVRDYDAPQSRVYTWFPGRHGLTNIAWTTLPQDARTVHALGMPSDLSQLDELGRARLIQPEAAFVLVLSEAPADLPAARGAMAEAGFGGAVVAQGSLVDGRLRYLLLRLTSKPAG